MTQRVALITGGGSGIGAATARRLATDGFEVVVAGRRADRLEQTVAQVTADGGHARAVVTDVTDPQSVAALAATLARCDVLVNNAGGAFGSDPVESADAQDWRRMYEVNVLGTLNLVQAVLPLLRAVGSASIVDIGSTAGYVNYEKGGGYTAAKHAVHALTETLRLELNGEPVRVIEIQPGMVATDEFAKVRFGGDEQAAAQVYAGVDHPLTADDVAECVAFCVGLPQHVNIDRLVVRPVAQSAQHKVHRGPIAWDGDTQTPARG